MTIRFADCNPWCTPPEWTAGQPEFYFSFENSSSLTLTNPSQIVDGTGVLRSFSSNPHAPRFVFDIEF